MLSIEAVVVRPALIGSGTGDLRARPIVAFEMEGAVGAGSGAGALGCEVGKSLIRTDTLGQRLAGIGRGAAEAT